MAREAPEPRSGHRLIVAVAAAGFAVSANFVLARISGEAAFFCAPGSACDVVHASRYAVFLGLPTAAWGAGLYGLIGGLALSGLTRRRWLVASLLAMIGAMGSAYLAYLALFDLREACAYCVVSAAIGTILPGVLFIRRPPIMRQRSREGARNSAGPRLDLTAIVAFLLAELHRL